jgi:hypothetical protein
VVNTLHINGFWNSRPDREHAGHKTGRDSAIYFSSAIGKPITKTMWIGQCNREMGQGAL